MYQLLEPFLLFFLSKGRSQLKIDSVTQKALIII